MWERPKAKLDFEQSPVGGHRLSSPFSSTRVFVAPSVFGFPALTVGACGNSSGSATVLQVKPFRGIVFLDEQARHNVRAAKPQRYMTVPGTSDCWDTGLIELTGQLVYVLLNPASSTRKRTRDCHFPGT